jgi:hypothetical protein
VANMFGGGMAEAAGGDGFPHAEAGDQPLWRTWRKWGWKSLGERKEAE